MADELEATIREAYAAFGRGDIDGYLKPCTEDFCFHVPGHGGIAGTYVGKQGLYDLASKAMSITGGTFHEEVEDVLANDKRGFSSETISVSRQPSSMTIPTSWRWR
jgi:ketosteroid isomerase-like protein